MVTPRLPTAVVHGRTRPHGAYRAMRGLRRGGYRVLTVRDIRGSYAVTSRHVLSVNDASHEGREGVTDRSRDALPVAEAYAVAARVHRAIARDNDTVPHAE